MWYSKALAPIYCQNIDNRLFMCSAILKVVTEIENMISEVVELQKGMWRRYALNVLTPTAKRSITCSARKITFFSGCQGEVQDGEGKH